MHQTPTSQQEKPQTESLATPKDRPNPSVRPTFLDALLKKKDPEVIAWRNLAAEQLRTGKSLFNKEGALRPLLEMVINSALDEEMNEHLRQAREEGASNRRNGRMSKEVRSSFGPITVVTPRDRDASFEPVLVKKRQRTLADGFADQIISMYASGNSTRDISAFVAEHYGMEMSAEEVSNIVSRVQSEVLEWRSRRLSSVYPIVWMDAVYYKVRDEETGSSTARAVYNVLGLNQDGEKELLGMYVGRSEGAKLWLNVLTDLQNRGVEDILIACVDGLTGFPEAIASIFPRTEVQLCVIHQIRNSVKYLNVKDRAPFMADLKKVYEADTKEQAEAALDKLEGTWNAKYPLVIKSWRIKWENLSCYFKYSKPIRKLIYTTNTVEGYHRQLRKVTKSKGLFNSDETLMRLLYLVYRKIAKTWATRAVNNWGEIAQQLALHFQGRFELTV